LPLASAALAAVKILGNGSGFRARQQRNLERVKTALLDAGFADWRNPGPILSLVPRHRGETRALKRSLIRRKILPVFIKYPGGPAGGYFRFAISSQHTVDQLDNLAGALIEARQG
jgi:7-keto-8-aminopelargonate synthetase-like enzyme